MKIVMEGVVTKKKNDKVFGALKQVVTVYHMVLTDQPRLYLMTPLTNEKVPKPQEYKKDIMLYDKLEARAIKRDKF